MNEFRAFTRAVFGGHHAMIRLAHKAEAEPIKGKGGNPILYGSELEAQKAASEHLCRYINGDLRRDGETLSNGVRAAAEALFAPVVKQRGRERRITVERRARG